MENSKLDEIKVYTKYHDEILKAWKMVEKEPAFKEIYKNKAFAQDKLYKNGILFLGVGASFDEKKKDTCTPKGEVEYETYKGRIGYDRPIKKHPERTEFKKGYNYYQRMIEIAKETGLNWSNIDITLFRETKQEVIQPFFKNSKDIMQKQMDIAREMILDTKPQIIVASNTLVRDVLENKRDKSIIESGFDFFYDSIEYGTPIITSPKKLNGIPIFFTSMLSGQRALDNGSFKRLKWHIKFVLDKRKKGIKY